VVREREKITVSPQSSLIARTFLQVLVCPQSCDFSRAHHASLLSGRFSRRGLESPRCAGFLPSALVSRSARRHLCVTNGPRSPRRQIVFPGGYAKAPRDAVRAIETSSRARSFRRCNSTQSDYNIDELGAVDFSYKTLCCHVSIARADGSDTMHIIEPANADAMLGGSAARQSQSACTSMLIIRRFLHEAAGRGARCRAKTFRQSGSWESRRGRITHALFCSAAPSSPIICSRMTNFCGLPVAVLGKSGTNRMCRGILKCAIWP
jgi:hypothetical protein